MSIIYIRTDWFWVSFQSIYVFTFWKRCWWSAKLLQRVNPKRMVLEILTVFRSLSGVFFFTIPSTMPIFSDYTWQLTWFLVSVVAISWRSSCSLFWKEVNMLSMSSLYPATSPSSLSISSSFCFMSSVNSSTMHGLKLGIRCKIGTLCFLLLTFSLEFYSLKLVLLTTQYKLCRMWLVPVIFTNLFEYIGPVK